MLSNVNFGMGKVEYDEFNINFNIDFKDQTDSLLEDLLQVNYKNKYTVDLGWYSEFNSNGKFVIYVICDHNWDEPIIKKNCKKKKI